jgi:hypothetical protein
VTSEAPFSHGFRPGTVLTHQDAGTRAPVAKRFQRRATDRYLAALAGA